MIDDDDDWQDLEAGRKIRRGPPTVTLRLTKKRYSGRLYRASSNLWFRNEAKAWISSFPQFRIQVGGHLANKLKIIPDSDGRFAWFGFKGTVRISLGFVSVWPDIATGPIEVEFKIDNGVMIAVIPGGIGAGMNEASPADETPPERGLSRAAWHILTALVHTHEAGAADLLAAAHTCAGGLHITDIDSYISGMAPKLKKNGIQLHKIFGGKYRLDAGSKARARIFLDAHRTAEVPG